MILWFKGSKNDQYRAGAARNHYRTGDPDGLCPVEAAAMLQRHFPERFTSEKHLPLCRWADGKPVKREDIQEILERAARAEGWPAEKVRSHSLRIGGATALYHIFGDIEIVKRWGRWASSAFHGYLWESNEKSLGIAKGMALDDTTIHVGYGVTEKGTGKG